MTTPTPYQKRIISKMKRLNLRVELVDWQYKEGTDQRGVMRDDSEHIHGFITRDTWYALQDCEDYVEVDTYTYTNKRHEQIIYYLTAK